jgi:arylsulfatase A-like enzyme
MAHRMPLSHSSRGALGAIGALLVTMLMSCGHDIDPAAARTVPRFDRPHQHRDPDSPPNVVFIVMDTVRADRMSFNGYPRTTTPFLDRFARDAVVYRGAHSAAPWTLPAHMSMFTGLLPGQHGATWRAFGHPEDMSLRDILQKTISLTDPSRLLTARLDRAGYSTLGLTNNAWVARRTGFDHGFDTFYEMWRERRALTNGYGWLPPAIRTSRELDLGDAGLTLLKLKQHALSAGGLAEPFFLFINFIDPHFPYSPPGLWRYLYSQDRALGERIARFGFSEMALVAGQRPVDVAAFAPFYDAELSYLDFAMGQLLTWLREQGYYDESMIVVTSDHGEHLGEAGRFSHQFSVEEELLRVPLVVKYPGNAGGGETVDDPLVSTVDVYQTILGTAGVPGAGAVPVSRDLRNRDALADRAFSIAESDYSVPYLRMHQEQHPAFTLSEHSVTRRVVYTREGRYVFSEPDRTGPAAAADPGRDRAASILAQYVATLGAALVREHGAAPDAAALERLRSLGYVK